MKSAVKILNERFYFILSLPEKIHIDQTIFPYTKGEMLSF